MTWREGLCIGHARTANLFCFNDRVGRSGRITVVLVLHQSDFETLVRSNLLHQGVSLVFKFVTRAMPVNDKSGDTQLF